MTGTCALATLSLILSAAEPAGSGEIEIPSALIKLSEQADVPAAEAGILATIAVREGHLLRADELIARIVDTEAQLEEARTRIEVEMARKNVANDVKIRFARKSVEVAKAELRRAEASNAKYPKSISDSEMDRLRLVVQRSELEVEQAEHDFQMAVFTRQIKENEQRQAAEKVRRHTISAPIAGLVVQVMRHQGEWVKPGETVIRMLRLDRLRAEGFVKLAALAHPLRDCPVRLVVDLPGGPATEFRGKVVFVHPEIDPVNSQVRIWAEVENPQFRLQPGMRARLYLQPAAKKR